MAAEDYFVMLNLFQIYWVGPYVGGVPAVFLYKFYAWVKERDESVPMRVIPPAAGSLKIRISIVFKK